MQGSEQRSSIIGIHTDIDRGKMKSTIRIFLSFIGMTLISCGGEELYDLSLLKSAEMIPSCDEFLLKNWHIEDTNDFKYMGADSSVTETETDPFGKSENLIRLEVFNLVENGGFELTPTGSVPDNWEARNSAEIGVYTGNAPRAGTISLYPGTENKSLYFNTAGGNAAAVFDLSSIKDGSCKDATYKFSFNFSSDTKNFPVPFDIRDSIKPLPFKALRDGDKMWAISPFPPADKSRSGSTTFTFKGTDPEFYLGNYSEVKEPTRGQGYFDDFKIVNTAPDYMLTADIPYSFPGRADLYSGIYKFSIYVKAEADSAVNPSVSDGEESANRFRTKAVTLAINEKKAYIAAPVSPESGWKKISIEAFIQIEKSGGIRLGISPVSKKNIACSLEPGSILFASPSLKYISE